MISKDVDGGPPPAMTITTNRRVNDFGAWYDSPTMSIPPSSWPASCSLVPVMTVGAVYNFGAWQAEPLESAKLGRPEPILLIADCKSLPR